MSLKIIARKLSFYNLWLTHITLSNDLNLRFMKLDNSMHNGNISAVNLEHDDLPCSDRILAIVGQKQEIATIESRLHATAVTQVITNIITTEMLLVKSAYCVLSV